MWAPKPKGIFNFQEKRSRQTEGQWSPVWGPKLKKFKFRSSKFHNPFEIIFRHLFSKRGGQDVKRWMPNGRNLEDGVWKGQNMPRIKLGAWSRVSKRILMPKGGNLEDEVGKRMSWQNMSRIKLGAWSRVSKRPA